MITRAACVPPLLLLLVTACSANRPPVTTSLPAPLVTALLNDRGTVRPSPEYAVRSLPQRFPSPLVPSGPVTVVGGMTNGDEIVAVFSDSTRRLAAVFEQLFNQAGFVRPAPSPGSGFSPGLGPYTYFCRDSATVTAEPLTGANRNLVRVTYRVQRGPRTCPTVQRGPAAGANELHLPELTPPPGRSRRLIARQRRWRRAKFERGVDWNRNGAVGNPRTLRGAAQRGRLDGLTACNQRASGGATLRRERCVRQGVGGRADGHWKRN